MIESPSNSATPSGRAETVISCGNLTASIDYYRDRLGFRLQMIFPADEPRVAVLEGHGLRVRLDTTIEPCAGRLRIPRAGLPAGHLPGAEVSQLTTPEGTLIDLLAPIQPPAIPALAPKVIIERGGPSARWGQGRAGMHYRDLMPGRLGGAIIASHIRIPEGGPVADYVHHHHVAFQLIFCRRGWVEVVYEDQGPPFVMQAGDCVLQPPHIRHQVLSCSIGFEALEVGGPAEHETLVDHDLSLPTATRNAERDFGGQRFVHHRVAEAEWRASAYAGLECRDTGIAAATDGLASALVLRPTHESDAQPIELTADSDLLFRFVLQGQLTLSGEDIDPTELSADDVFVIPPSLPHSMSAPSADLELFEVTASP